VKHPHFNAILEKYSSPFVFPTYLEEVTKVKKIKFLAGFRGDNFIHVQIAFSVDIMM
jgi:hypothetical protein